MVFVTGELDAVYAEYEAGNSGGLTYDMYKRFVKLLQRCRIWMKQTEVVSIITEQEYA
jgi:hypothetical protein